MAEVNPGKLGKKRKSKKKIFAILILILIVFGVIGVIGYQKGLIDIGNIGIPDINVIGKKGAQSSVGKDQMRKKLASLGYKEQRIKDLSIFSSKRGEKHYKCNLYYKPKLKGNVELSANMSQPTDKGMWAVVKDLTLNDSKFKETLVLLLSLTENKIDLKDVQKRLEKNIKKNRPPESSGIYYLRVEKRKHSLQLRANWHRGKIYLEYGVDI